MLCYRANIFCEEHLIDIFCVRASFLHTNFILWYVLNAAHAYAFMGIRLCRERMRERRESN